MDTREKIERVTEQGARRRLSLFARRLLAEWKRLALPLADERVLVAVSGGADSTALLLAFDELLKTRRLALGLMVAHLEHGLRGARGEEDARWVGELATQLGYDFELGRAAVGARLHEQPDNLEQAARRARYAFLREMARASGARMILTAHTLDDQAETVLLALLRGSGAEGLSGIRPVRVLDSGDDLRLVRPLVGWARRADTERVCRERDVAARSDEMNMDERFARVRVRRTLVPLLETFNPRAVGAIARASELLRDDAAALETQAARLLSEASEGHVKEREKGKRGKGEEGKEGRNVESRSQKRRGGRELEDGNMDGERVGDERVGDERVGDGNMIGGVGVVASLRVEVLAGAEVAVRRRALRQWIALGRGDLRRVEMAHVSAVEGLLEGVRGGRVAELPGGGRVARRRGRLWFYIELS